MELEKFLKGYSKDWVVIQGEVGCPSQLEFAHALNGIEWTEYSQAKWDLRLQMGAAVREKPWYVEVAGNKLVAHGSGGESETFTFSTAFEFAKWASTRPSGSEYFVLIVRPSGAKNYGFAVAELENEGYRYGVDLIGETRELLFLPSQGKERP